MYRRRSAYIRRSLRRKLRPFFRKHGRASRAMRSTRTPGFVNSNLPNHFYSRFGVLSSLPASMYAKMRWADTVPSGLID